MGLSKILDKIGDALVPKEIAPFLGPAAMAFAGPLGPFASMAIGQLGSMKMHGGKLDPYTAAGTFLANRASGFEGTTLDDRLKAGLGSFNDGPVSKGGSTFMDAFMNAKPSVPEPTNRFKRLEDFESKKTGLDKDLEAGTIDDSAYSSGIAEAEKGLKFGDRLIGKGSEFFDSASGKLLPGFGNFEDSIATIGSITTFTQMKPMAEELKKARIKDEREEGKIWTEWFSKYKGFTGYDYSESKSPDPFITDKYNKYKHLLANGGRVGYNMGGDTGIIAAAPGMPQGMQLDGRDGIFVSQGIEEKADDVPAMLSKNEFVLTADAMKGFDKMTGGSGNPREAAQKMYELMDQMEAVA